MELKNYCIGFDRTIENKEEKRTMDWLNKSNVAIPQENISAIKDLILCMDVLSPSYAHLIDVEKKKVEYLLNNEQLVSVGFGRNFGLLWRTGSN